MNSLEWRGAQWHDERFHRRVRHEFAARWKDFDAIYVHGSVQLAVEATRHRPTVLRLPGPVGSELEALLRAVSVVCANGDALAQLRNFMGEEVIDLPVGIDSTAFSPRGFSVRPSLGWTEKHKVIGYVGRLTQLKGVDVLARAFHQVAPLFPEARLMLIGHGEEESRVRHILAKEIGEGRARLVPGMDPSELGAWYRAMDAFVLPSRYENFSNALLEAAACGVPFIASDIGGNSIFQKACGGDLFEPGSFTALSRSLQKFMTDPAPRHALAQVSAQAIRERYDWNASADRLEGILQSRLALRPSAPAFRL